MNQTYTVQPTSITGQSLLVKKGVDRFPVISLQMATEEAEFLAKAANSYGEIREALAIARQYVQSLHSTVKSATGVEDNIVKPDLDKVNEAFKL